MGLFGKFGKNSSDNMSRGVAVVKASNMIDNNENRSGRNVEVRENSLNALNLGTIPHDLTLEVRPPGRPPFEVMRRVKVPAKATGRQGYQLPVGVELPVTFAGADPSDFDIDWKAFLAAPESKAAVQKAASDASYAHATAYTQAKPGMTEQTWANAAAGLPMWMAAVRSGKMKRKAFDQQVDTLSRIGQMDPELAAEAKRSLTAEGL